MKKPLVSALICTYNSENYIDETIQSIVHQTYENLELIIVDDASTDSTPEIVRKYEKEYSWIHVIYLEENMHCVNASNIGFDYSKGEYFACIGYDDLWAPEKIEKQVSFMETNTEYAVCFTHCEIIDDKSENISEESFFSKLFCQPNRTTKEWVLKLMNSNQFCAGSAMIRRKCIGNHKLYQYGLLQLQDYELWLRLIKDYPIYILQEKLTFYRWFVHEKSNLSYPSVASVNRFSHENDYILFRYITELTDQQLTSLFADTFLYQNASTNEELLCERAFLLMKLENCRGIGYFIDLLDRDDVREILETKYNFTLQDFYKLNSKSMLFDTEVATELKEAKRQIEIYEAYIKDNIECVKQTKNKVGYYLARCSETQVEIASLWKFLFSCVLCAMDCELNVAVWVEPTAIANTENSIYDYLSFPDIRSGDIVAEENNSIDYLTYINNPNVLSQYRMDFSHSNWITESNMELLGPLYNHFFKPKDWVIERADWYWNQYFSLGEKVLGVNYLIEKKEMDETLLLRDNSDVYLQYSINCLDEWNCSAIYLLTRDVEIIEAWKKSLGDLVITVPFESNDSELLRFMIEIELLARCNSLMGIMSEQVSFAIMRNDSKYDFLDIGE